MAFRKLWRLLPAQTLRRSFNFFDPFQVLHQGTEGVRGSAVGCCATSRKVTGSIPDCAILIFHRHNPFSRTMALRATQRLTEMSTRNISCGVKAAGA